MINLSMAEPDNILRPRIAVMGVGGAGGNAINNMINSQLSGCEFVAANTDSQALAMSLAPHKIQLGVNLSRGLGAGSKPEIGRAAAEEQLNDIISCLEGADMLFVTAGMGGGTGTGAAPVVARAAREAGILTVGVVTKPFHFEGSQRMRQAESGIADLQQYVDTLIVIPNQNLFRIANERTTFAEAFRLADEVLHSGVRGITDLMVMPGFMNLDFADVKTVMQEMGKAMMGTGEAEGDNRAIRAAEAAISNPLLDDISMKGARGVLINITGGMDMTLFEVDQAATRIREEVDPDAQIKVGSTLGEALEGRIRVSVIATGIDAALAEQQKQRERVTATPNIVRNIQPVAPRPAAVREETQRPAAVQAQQPAPVVATPTNVATASVNNVASSYFTMPQMMTPQMVPHKVESIVPVVQEETERAVEEKVAAPVRQAEEVLATQTATPPSPATHSIPQKQTGTTAPRSGVVSPIRSMPPVSSRTTEAQSEASRDMRVTRLTTPPAAASNSFSPQGNHRSQSLFQRITGFGLVRPSSQDDLEDDLTAEAPPKIRLNVDPVDQTPLSSEPTDLLDIPAFLRRQTNH